MSSPPEPRDLSGIQSIEREIARVEQAGPSLDLARLLLRRVDLLQELDEGREAARQLTTLVELLEGLAGLSACLLLARTLARCAHFALEREEDQAAAISSLEDAVEALDRAPPAEASEATFATELAELSVELRIDLGRLQLMASTDGGESSLHDAVELAEALTSPRGPLLLLRARRELAVALAQTSIDAGLEELSRAEAAATEVPRSKNEDELLVSTRAELLANGGRFVEALRLLEAEVDKNADWVLSQRAVICEMADRQQEAEETGVRLVELRARNLDPDSPSSCHALAEVLLAHGRRTGNPEVIESVASRVLSLFAEFVALPPRTLRLVTEAQELLSRLLEPEQAYAVLVQRDRLIQGLVRDTGAERDQLDQLRSHLQLGDALMRLGRIREARRYYEWAEDGIRRLPPKHPFVIGALPSALNAQGQSLAADDLWLAARERLDEAANLFAGRHDPRALLAFAEVSLFRAIAYVNVSDPTGAVARLEEDIPALLASAAELEEPNSELVDSIVNLCVLEAEISVDHLEDVDQAVDSYDRALELRTHEQDPLARASILGAKGSVLNEFGRNQDALEFLRLSLALLEQAPPDEDGDLPQDDIALALVNIAASLSGLGQPKDALKEIARAKGLLDQTNGDRPSGEEIASRHQAITTHLYLRRGEALLQIGHPLLAADEFSRSIDLCRELLDEEGEAKYEGRLRLPLALLQRAQCWLKAGDHETEAKTDLREAHHRYSALVLDESRPAHRRRLHEVRALRKQFRKNSSQPEGLGTD